MQSGSSRKICGDKYCAKATVGHGHCRVSSVHETTARRRAAIYFSAPSLADHTVRTALQVAVQAANIHATASTISYLYVNDYQASGLQQA